MCCWLSRSAGRQRHSQQGLRETDAAALQRRARAPAIRKFSMISSTSPMAPGPGGAALPQFSFFCQPSISQLSQTNKFSRNSKKRLLRDLVKTLIGRCSAACSSARRCIINSFVFGFARVPRKTKPRHVRNKEALSHQGFSRRAPRSSNLIAIEGKHEQANGR